MNTPLIDIKQLKSKVSDAFGEAFTKLSSTAQPGQLFLTMRIFQPLPLSWPTNGSGRVVFFAYCYSLSGVSGGERITKPFGKIVANLFDDSLVYSPLTESFEPLGIQGTGFATTEEIELFNRGEECQTILCESTRVKNAVLPEKVLEYYRMIGRNNMVISLQLAKLAPQVFEILIGSGKTTNSL